MSANGKFIGKVRTDWSDGSREMTILKDFAYIDPNGRQWPAPKGSIVDGASIPRPLWTFVGAPFTGKYRNASVVHDVACEQMSAPSQDVHRMFYFACRCGGVAEITSKIMYGAVWQFGPSWMWPDRLRPKASISIEQINNDFEALKQFVDKENPSLEQIEAFR